ncbi:MAG: autotransporter domain-containing protein [Pseudomonadota bacterium]|nr:autotransporter domain-containing protein [Pseudomonadota bacterium]
MLRPLIYSSFAIALAAAPAQAQNVFIADLRGASEVPPAASPASGFALVLFDRSFQTMTVRTTFSGLIANTVDGHIHCCVPPTANAVVAVGFRPAGFPLGVTGGQFSATFDLNSATIYNPPFRAANGGTAASARTALINGTQAGLSYVNIHTTRFPGGEIRGQLFTGGDLTPQALTLLPEVALQTAEFHDGIIRRHLHHARRGENGPDGQSATLGDGRVGLFLSGGLRSGAFEERTNRPRVALGSRGLVGGIDYRLGPTTLIGAMGGYDATDARLTPTSRQSQVKSWFAGGYGSTALGPAFLDLYASYARSDYDLSRRISVATFTAESLAETESEQWMLGGTAGLSLRASALDVEPYVGARYVSLDLDPFTETGNIAALTIDADDIESLESIVGLSVGADIPVGAAAFRPSVRAEWRHEFQNDEPRLIGGSFGGAAPFDFLTSPLRDDHAVVGAGFSVAGGGPLSMTVDYTGQLGGGYDIHALTGGLRLSF